MSESVPEKTPLEEKTLPEQTSDDRDVSGGDWREQESSSDHDDWLRSQRPPHWE